MLRPLFLARVFLLIVVAGFLLLGKGYWNATRDPIIRSGTIKVEDWPTGAPPVRVLLISDIHIAGPDMPPQRMARIARQLSALKPDLILIAGDLVSDKRLATRIYSVPEIIAPLKALRAPLGVVIALGNHDHWFAESAIPAEIRRAGMTVLINQAIKRGPLVIGGVDDDFTHHADLPRTFAAMAQLSGPRIIVTHSPDIVPNLPSPVAAVFAGHTHCGQILRPWSGEPVDDVSRYGRRFRCGLIDDAGQKVVVGAGLGTSVVWLRYLAPPDVWLVTLGP